MWNALPLAALSAVAWAASQPAQVTAEFPKTTDGLGPLNFVVQVNFPTKSTQHMVISVAATNNTGVHLRHVNFCVQLEGRSCSATFWTESSWPPATSRTRSVAVDGHLVGVTASKPSGIKASEIALAIREIERDRFAEVHRIYVEKFEGDFGSVNDLVREQVMAAVVNSKRFQLVDDRILADAYLKGRAERRERGTAVQSSGQEQSLNKTSGIAGGVGGGVNSIVSVLAAGRSKTTGSLASETNSRTEVLFSEYLILRLTTVTGESIWAWDDTNPCEGSHPRCAIEDLKLAAIVPTR